MTRVYANLDDVLAGVSTHYAGRGTVTSGTTERGHEGTTFEMSCYTDPLGIEHLTGSGCRGHRPHRLRDAWAPVRCGSPRSSTRSPGSLALPHGRPHPDALVGQRRGVAGRYEGGTAPVPARLAALRRLALAGYRRAHGRARDARAGLARAYGTLLDDVAVATSAVRTST